MCGSLCSIEAAVCAAHGAASKLLNKAKNASGAGIHILTSNLYDHIPQDVVYCIVCTSCKKSHCNKSTSLQHQLQEGVCVFRRTV